MAEVRVRGAVGMLDVKVGRSGGFGSQRGFRRGKVKGGHTGPLRLERVSKVCEGTTSTTAVLVYTEPYISRDLLS